MLCVSVQRANRVSQERELGGPRSNPSSATFWFVTWVSFIFLIGKMGIIIASPCSDIVRIRHT